MLPFVHDIVQINAEAKKKVDVLSEELLPYIIAEQERRTTLYKRIMTAIQNGEKGVTIAEIRNKPPLIIRKGLMFRCPSNRAPKEPDGSGVLMCEKDVEPAPVMYDSCLSAEDRELYVAENKYFFCNRHKVEGPDLPRNGSTVIGCAPVERTSLNYTTSKCTLEDTDDVVVHYRYYPDRTYKYVTELDPDREVCEHWKPCQIGYIYSLPSPDQAVVANELWHDSLVECMNPMKLKYKHSPRRLRIPQGYQYQSIWRSESSAPLSMNHNSSYKMNHDFNVNVSPDGTYVEVDIKSFTTASSYQVRFEKVVDGRTLHKVVPLLTISNCTILVDEKSIDGLPGQRVETVTINYQCGRCQLLQIVIRATDWNVYNLDRSRYRLRKTVDRKFYIEIGLENLRVRDFGSYFGVFQNDDGVEERVKILVVHLLQVPQMKSSVGYGEHFDKSINYQCEDCELTDIMCGGESVLPAGRVSHAASMKMISLNFPNFEDAYSCVYIGIFNTANKVYRKVIAVIDNVTVNDVGVINAPQLGEPFEKEFQVSCTTDCSVEKVTVNGIPLDLSMSRRSGSGPIAFYVATPSAITIRITEYVDTFEGVYQAVFNLRGDTVTKTLMEIKDASIQSGQVEDGGQDSNTDTTPAAIEYTVTGAETTSQAASGMYSKKTLVFRLSYIV
ncbi:uncharacterized protein LOC131845266 [Achroia grisella]|uniref:uncharacterized protein LOC131845266 n=1 Tax=Achroia grisella TaxID=688607 RepID=UPI0027D1EBBE|nr:uncharacterized protein LOC131845266 [Achroia grisella]